MNYLVSICLCLGVVNVFAGTFRLETLVGEVLSRNKDIAAARERIRAAEEVVERVQVWEDPEFMFMSDYNNFKSNSRFMPELRYSISQAFPISGKLKVKGRVASQLLEQAKNREITTVQDLILEAKRLYFQLFLNYRFFEINRENDALISRIIDTSLDLYKVGKSNYEDVIKAQVELQTIKEEFLKLEAERAFIVAMINGLLNRSQNEVIEEPLGYSFPMREFESEVLEKIAFLNRPELKELKAMISEQEFAAELARREYVPDLIISGIYEQQRKHLSDNAFGASIGFKIPIWAPSRQGREVKEATAKANANRSTLQAMEFKIRAQIGELLAKLNSVKERIVLYETGLIAKALEAFKVAEFNYKTGKGEFLLLLDARRQYQSVSWDYQQAKIEREILLSELSRAIGVDLEEVE